MSFIVPHKDQHIEQGQNPPEMSSVQTQMNGKSKMHTGEDPNGKYCPTHEALFCEVSELNYTCRQAQLLHRRPIPFLVLKPWHKHFPNCSVLPSTQFINTEKHEAQSPSYS